MRCPDAAPIDALLAVVGAARQLDRHPEPAQLHRGAVLLARQQHAVRLDVAVDDVVIVAVLQRLQYVEW